MLAEMGRVANSVISHFEILGMKGVLQRALIVAPYVSNVFTAAIPNSARKISLRIGTTDVSAFEHVFIKNEYGFSLAQEPSVIIDAGANVGMSAVYFAQRFSKAKVIAVEPDPENFNILRKNAELFPTIVPINAALWNDDCVVKLKDGGGGSWGMQVGNVERFENQAGDLVRAIKLRTLLDEFGIEQVDLLKIDVEGAECEIFEDSKNWIDRVNVICVELHDRFRPGCSEAFETATGGFPARWQRGELTCVAREDWISAK